MLRVPFESTTVSERKSMTDVMFMLEETGFEKTAHLNDRGKRSIHALFANAEFRFEVDTAAVEKALVDNSGRRKQMEIRRGSTRGRAWMDEIKERAVRIGWRLMAEHVKGVCDAIKLGVISPAQAFAGNLVVGMKDGRQVTLAEQLTIAIDEGSLNSPSFLNPLMLEAPAEKVKP